jgi:hypothetical protein
MSTVYAGNPPVGATVTKTEEDVENGCLVIWFDVGVIMLTPIDGTQFVCKAEEPSEAT